MRTTVPIVECCSSLLDSPLGQAEAEQLAAAFKVIADPARLRLLSLLASKPEGEACVCDLGGWVTGERWSVTEATG